ncbi:MAG: hypothetical protein L0Z62_15490 [Gemmataceae bacterium]|nr:hypothetical protein [Gemmataceae bacterium]
MSFRRVFVRRKPLCLLLAVLASAPGPALSQECGPSCHAGLGAPIAGGSCGSHCQRHHCPPRFKYCQEGPPRLHFQKGCPRPVCPPGCDTPNWGYFQPCWRPWGWSPDWSHCPYLVPAATVVLPPAPPVQAPGAGEQLHQPRRADLPPGM